MLHISIVGTDCVPGYIIGCTNTTAERRTMIKPHNIPIFHIHQHVHKTYHYPESNTPIEHQVHHCHHHGIIDNAPRKNWDSCCCMYPGHHAEMHPYRNNPHHGNLDGPENRSFLFPPAICVPCNTDHALKHYSHTCNCYDGLGNYYPDERCQCRFHNPNNQIQHTEHYTPPFNSFPENNIDYPNNFYIEEEMRKYYE